ARVLALAAVRSARLLDIPRAASCRVGSRRHSRVVATEALKHVLAPRSHLYRGRPHSRAGSLGRDPRRDRPAVDASHADGVRRVGPAPAVRAIAPPGRPARSRACTPTRHPCQAALPRNAPRDRLHRPEALLESHIECDARSSPVPTNACPARPTLRPCAVPKTCLAARKRELCTRCCWPHSG